MKVRTFTFKVVKAIKQTNVSTKTKWSRNSMAQTRVYVAGTCKGRTSHGADTDVLLPDKPKTFFSHIEDNTMPPTQPAPKDCGLSFSVANVSKTF